MKSSYRIARRPLVVGRALLSASALAFGLGATAAQAQDSADAAAGGLDEIVVTARKVAENLQDVPVAITAFSGEALAQQNSARIIDVARLTPSLTIREANSNPSAMSITLRGQVQTDVLATLDPSVGTYVDGYYWARAYGANADLLDISNVQILKGPQGTLFGRNTTGGAILLETNDPSFDGINGRVSATYGRFDERKLEGVINLPLGDRLAVRGALQRNLRDGRLRDVNTGLRYDDRDSWTARGKLLFQATDNLSFLFSGEYYKSDTNAPSRRMLYLIPSGLTPPPMSDAVKAAAVAAGFPTSYPAIGASGAAFARSNLRDFYVGLGDDSVGFTTLPEQDVGDFRFTSANGAPVANVKTQTYTSTINLDTFFGAIKFIGGWRKVESFSRIDLDGSPSPIHRTIGTQDLEQYSGELQITGKALADAIDFAAGAFYFNESGRDGSTSISIPTLNAVTGQFDGQIFNDSIGVYGQATWHVTDRLSFTGGLRYSVDDKGLTSRNRNFNRTTKVFTCAISTAVLAEGCAATRHNEFEGISYLASLDYRLTDDVLVYAKTSKGFRSGGQNLRAPSDDGFVPFQPEIAYAHEAGLKSEFFDRRVRLNLAGYYSTVNDIQRTTLIGLPGGGTSTLLSNAGKIRIWGVEGELTAQVFEGFQLGATGSITKPKYKKYSEVPSRTNLDGDRTSERVENVPEYTFSVSASYEHQFDFGRFNIRTDYSWSDSYPVQPYTPFLGDPLGVTIDPNTGRTIAEEIIRASTAPSAGVLGARASITVLDDSLELAVYGRNITDDRSIVSSLYVGGIGYVAGQLREPRTYGLQATYRFGQ